MKIETTLSISAIYIQRILDIQVTWNIQADGTVDIAMDVKTKSDFPDAAPLWPPSLLAEGDEGRDLLRALVLWRAIWISVGPAGMGSSLLR